MKLERLYRNLIGSAQTQLEKLCALLDRRLGGRLSLLAQTALAFDQDDGPLMARSIAYCAVFPAIPALIVVAGAMLQSQEVQESVMALVEQYMPIAADAVAANIKQLLAMSGTIGLGTLVGLIWSAPWQFSLVSRGTIPVVSAQDAFALLPAAWPSRSCTVRTKS